MTPRVFVLNGWAASEHAWDLCAFERDAVFSDIDHVGGRTARAFDEAAEPVILVGWSMGGSYALRLAAQNPQRVAGLVLVAATPRMMKADGWTGMTERRLAALEMGLRLTLGGGFFGIPKDKPNPYRTDREENLARGIAYLRETDLRAALEAKREAFKALGVYIFQSERDGIVRRENADYLAGIFPRAHVQIVPGAEHALPIFIPEALDAAVAALRASAGKPTQLKG
jgi:pimeloyl-[acyl-carrier protein] methyl ester esterase